MDDAHQLKEAYRKFSSQRRYACEPSHISGVSWTRTQTTLYSRASSAGVVGNFTIASQ